MTYTIHVTGTDEFGGSEYSTLREALIAFAELIYLAAISTYSISLKVVDSGGLLYAIIDLPATR